MAASAAQDDLSAIIRGKRSHGRGQCSAMSQPRALLAVISGRYRARLRMGKLGPLAWAIEPAALPGTLAPSSTARRYHRHRMLASRWRGEIVAIEAQSWCSRFVPRGLCRWNGHNPHPYDGSPFQKERNPVFQRR